MQYIVIHIYCVAMYFLLNYKAIYFMPKFVVIFCTIMSILMGSCVLEEVASYIQIQSYMSMHVAINRSIAAKVQLALQVCTCFKGLVVNQLASQLLHCSISYCIPLYCHLSFSIELQENNSATQHSNKTVKVQLPTLANILLNLELCYFYSELKFLHSAPVFYSCSSYHQ